MVAVISEPRKVSKAIGIKLSLTANAVLLIYQLWHSTLP